MNSSLSYLVRQQCYARIICVLDESDNSLKVSRCFILTDALLGLRCDVDNLGGSLGLVLDHVLHEGEGQDLLDAL